MLTMCCLARYRVLQRVYDTLLPHFFMPSSMEQARDDLANELASGTPNYSQAVAGAARYCPLIAHVLRSLEKAVRNMEQVCLIASLKLDFPATTKGQTYTRATTTAVVFPTNSREVGIFEAHL